MVYNSALRFGRIEGYPKDAVMLIVSFFVGRGGDYRGGEGSAKLNSVK